MTRVLNVTGGITVEVQTGEGRLECLLMSSCTTPQLMRKGNRSKGRNAEFYVINVTPATE
jgi:hypothetical protein